MATKKSNPVLSDAEQADIAARMHRHVAYTLEQMKTVRAAMTSEEFEEIVRTVTWEAIDWAQSLEIE